MNNKKDILEKIKQLPADKQKLLFAQLEKLENKSIDKPLDINEDSFASFGQQGLWNLYEVEGPGNNYNMPSAYQLNNFLCTETLIECFKIVVSRHDSLRTYFKKENDELMQKVYNDQPFNVDLISLEGIPENEQRDAVFKLIEDNGKHIFKLEQYPLFKVSIIKVSPDFHVLMMNAHHIIFDGWSKGVLLKELFELYTNLSGKKIDELSKQNAKSQLPMLPIQYRDHANWERKQSFIDKQVAYWKKELADSPHLLDIGDKARTARSSDNGFAIPIKLDGLTSQSLLNLGRKQGATPFMTMVTTFAIMLARYARQPEVLIGTPIDNRSKSELKNLIGYFLNTSVLKAKVIESMSFIETLNVVKKNCTELYSNQDAPFNRVVEAINPVRSLGVSPLFQAMFVFQVAGASDLKLPNIEIKQIDNEKIDLSQLNSDEDPGHINNEEEFIFFSSKSKYDLYLTFIEETDTDALSGWLTFNGDLFSQNFIKNFLLNYIELLKNIARKPNIPLYEIPLEQHKKALQQLESVKINQTVATEFEQQMKKQPESVALIDGKQTITYQELDNFSNHIANKLISKDVKPGDKIAIYGERSFEIIATMLATFKVGAAYVPLDYGLPAARIKQYLDNAQPKLVATISDNKEIFEQLNQSITLIDKDDYNIQEKASINFSVNVCSNDTAYLLYTSGSTGIPKGVMATHSATLNRIQWFWDTYPACDGEVMCHKTNYGFVDSVAEIWAPLLAGLPLVIAAQQTVLDMFKFVELLKTHNVSRLTLVPSLLLSMLEHYPELGEKLPSLKLVISSGETLQTDLSNKFYEALPNSLLLNIYGSTEVAADATYYEVPSNVSDIASSSIGKPITNCNVHILDEYLNPCPVGIKGEIFVGGSPVSMGYHNDPQLNAIKFIPNHISQDGSRLFSSNDLGRLLPNGQVEYLGRNDNQVKIRGFRINLDEIQQAISNHQEVKDSVVTISKNTNQEQMLVAYIVPEEESEYNLQAGTIRSYLKTMLPDYMAPQFYEFMEEFPLLDSGKVDRKNLPIIDLSKSLSDNFEAPVSETEILIAGIWQSVLQIEKIGRNDNFFDLGGHSISATRISSLIRERFNVDVPVQDIFLYLTVAELSSHIDGLLKALKLLDSSNKNSSESAEEEMFEF